ncbi:MAG: hypothetical protein FWD58_09330 [Firmicutes bacterium]|nr:hypothetical protein [Bacillota bacterium]
MAREQKARRETAWRTRKGKTQSGNGERVKAKRGATACLVWGFIAPETCKE